MTICSSQQFQRMVRPNSSYDFIYAPPETEVCGCNPVHEQEGRAGRSRDQQALGSPDHMLIVQKLARSMAEQNPDPEDPAHDDCKVWWQLAYLYARKRGATVPKIYARRVSNNLYAVWMEHCGVRIAHCVTACCATRGKAEFVDTYLIVEETEPSRSHPFVVSSRREDVRAQTDAEGFQVRRPRK
jgi:hypothetical protein